MAAAGASWVGGALWARRRFVIEWERREVDHLTGHEETHRLIKDLSDRIDQRAEKAD